MYLKKLALALPLVAVTAFASTAMANSDHYTIVLDATSGINAAYPTGFAYGAAGESGITIHDDTAGHIGYVTEAPTFTFNDFLKTAFFNGATFDFNIDYTATTAGDLLDLGYTAGAKAITYQKFGTPPKAEGVKVNGHLVAFDNIPKTTTGSYLINDAQATLIKGLNVIDLFGTVGPKGSQQITLGVTVAPVPEPEQWAMLLLGLPLIARVAGRKKVA
jgi:hypothetical protein